ncbi:MAG: HD domain-containing protein [Candidatus Magasanikbacteria bacterium]
MANTHTYTHLRGDKVTRIELIERTLVQTILKSKMPENKRAWGKVFELKHSSSVIQIGRMLAQKRKLKEDLAAVICALHDIHVNSNGDEKDHANASTTLSEKILRKTKKFTDNEIKVITNAIKEHSNKHLDSKNPYTELIKDADVFDCSLYDGMHDAYVAAKPPAICKTYFARIQKVRREFGLPHDKQWDTIKYLNK